MKASIRQSDRREKLRGPAPSTPMPIYEFDCPDCHARVSLFFRTFGAAQVAQAAPATLRCPRCQGARLRRAVSRVAVLRSEAGRMAALDDAANLDALGEDDPRAMAHLMRAMSDELGESMDAETSEIVGRMEAGEMPDA